ncbi:MAG: WbuC family cupin fold metalloprotein [Sediminibacterium sp.]
MNPMINHAVKAIICDEDGRFLLQKRDTVEGLPFSGCWNFFGGLVDPYEEIGQALTRELKEELNIDIHETGKEIFCWKYKENWYTTFNHFFYIHNKVDKDKITLNEGAGMGWFHLHEIVTLDLTPAVYENYGRVISSCAPSSEKILPGIENALLEKCGIIKKNDRVYYARKNPFGLSRQTMGLFKELAILKDLPVVRICLHDTDASDVHEMLMIHAKPHSVGPLKQLKTSLSYHVIDGTLGIFLYDDAGNKTNEYRVSNDQSIPGSVSSIRLNAAEFRSVKNISQTAIFLEVASGPFKDDDTIWLS